MCSLSVVVVMYNMTREAKRTLFSLSSDYQMDVERQQYEIIVVDNGSDVPLGQSFVESYGSNFRYIEMGGQAHPSPARAVNTGIAHARGSAIGIMIDGARIASPKLISMTLLALRLHSRPVVVTLAWHIGPDIQRKSIQNGYNKEVEDKLLSDAKWEKHGYRLFSISTLAVSSRGGYFRPIAESNSIFMPRQLVEELDGFDESFDLPGGGLVNLDFYHRACSLQQSQLVLLLGEGTFHQVHGGVATGSITKEYNQKAFAQYAKIRGQEYRSPIKDPIYLGSVPPELMPVMSHSALMSQEKTGIQGKRVNRKLIPPFDILKKLFGRR